MVAAPIDLRAGVRLFCCLVVWLAGADRTYGQAPDRALEFEDLGLTRAGEISARAGGLSGFVSSTGDVTALVYNPAGLCRVKQRTPLLGLSHDTQEVITNHGAGATGLSSDRNGLVFAGGAFSIPTIRGSLVPAVAVHRIFVSDLDISYQGTNTVDDRHDEFLIQQSGATYAFDFGFGIDLASVLSAGLSMSVFEGGYHSIRQSYTRTEAPPSRVDRYVIDEIDGDLDGLVARIGLMLYAHRHAHIGVNVTTPTLVNQTSRQSSEITEVVENGTGYTVRTTSESATEYVIPFRLEGGIEMPWGDWLLAVQAGTCDWTEAAIDQGRLRLQNGNAVLGRSVDLRAGVEWTAPWWPLRVRAGVARLPFAPEYVQADRVDNDQLEEVVSESAPLRLSFGAGVALKNTILIDAAFSRTTGDRNATSFSETREWSQLVIEGSYWF